MPQPERTSKGWKAKIARAFAVEKPGDIEPTPRQREIVDRLCREVVRRGLSTPAIMALEMSRPLNVLGASALHMLNPIIGAVMDGKAAEDFAVFLEHRGSIDYLCGRIEFFESPEAAASGRESDDASDDGRAAAAPSTRNAPAVGS